MLFQISGIAKTPHIFGFPAWLERSNRQNFNNKVQNIGKTVSKRKIPKTFKNRAFRDFLFFGTVLAHYIAAT
ncbi:MAG: hypothetical protein K5637_03520 [Lachnospiraceae bacterium]|nr:hypothetical protein [Lachnospiraceae bacterium]